MRSLNAAEVLDRAQFDFTRQRATFDVIVDIGGDHSLGATLRGLKPGGRLVIVGARKGVLRRLLMGVLRRRFFKQPIIFFVAHVRPEDLVALRELIESGKLTPVVDRTYALADTAAAVAYAEGMQARGKVARQRPLSTWPPLAAAASV